MTAHANVLGGSNAARLLACPASFKEQLRSPPATPSVYADEGSLLHGVIADVLSAGKPKQTGYLLDQEQQDTIEKALAMLGDLKRGWGGGFKIVGIEETLPFPGVTGSFGTVDLVLASPKVVLIIDHKFGQGVPVRAIYEDPDGTSVINAQLMFYALCARAKRPHLFKKRKIVLAIVQPRLDSVSDVVTDVFELDEFQTALTAAYLEALGSDPHRERGEHCRFAPCKATCPLWTGPVFDLAVIDPLAAQLRASQATTLNGDYSAFLSRALTLAELAETWADEIRKQGHAYLEGGGLIPDWKLVPKRATRQWTDPEVTAAELIALGADDADIYEPAKLRSVAQMEKALKPKGIAVPDDLYIAASSGTTLAHVDDRRPDATQATVTAELQKALAAL